MKLFTIYKRPLSASYKHQLCSFAFIFVLCIAALVIILPFLVVEMTNRELRKVQLTLYEQPRLQFDHEYIFVANFEHKELADEEKVVICSSYLKLASLTETFQDCSSIEVSASLLSAV